MVVTLYHCPHVAPAPGSTVGLGTTSNSVGAKGFVQQQNGELISHIDVSL